MTAYEPCSDCSDPEHCAVRELMRETRTALCAVLDTRSLKSLTERSRLEAWMQPLAGDAA